MTAHVEDRLSAYLDGELPAPERVAVEEHLAACVDCERRLEQLAALDAAARALPVVAPAGYFEALPERVRARLQARRGGSAWRLPVWSWAAAAALLLVVVTPPLLWRAARAPVRQMPEPPTSGQLVPAPSAEMVAPAATLPESKRDALKALGYVDGQPSKAPAGKLRKLESPARQADAPSASRLPRFPAAVPPPVTVYATPTPPAAFATEPRESLTVAQAEEIGALGSERERSQQAKKPVAAGRRAPGTAAVGAAPARTERSSAEARYADLLAQPRPRSLAEARGMRDAWRGFVADHAGDPLADEARVRAIEAGVALHRMSGDARDLESVRQEATTYLTRDDARQLERVRALLRELER
jgi:hypothetical protein